MLLDGGSVPDEREGKRTVIGSRWLREAWAVDADARSVFVASPAEVSMPGGWYRNRFWFRPGPYGDVLLCQGIHGQLVHVTRRTRTVCVKSSSWPESQNPGYLQDTLARLMRSQGRSRAGRPPGKTRCNRESLRARAATANPIAREMRHRVAFAHLTEGGRVRLTLDSHST